MMILLGSSYRTINRKSPIVILTIKLYNSMKFYRKLSNPECNIEAKW
jgi:hypothetical protein